MRVAAHSIFAIAFSALLALASTPAFAEVGPGGSHVLPKTEVKWVTAWKDILAGNHSVKDDLERIYEDCFPSSLPKSAIKVYSVDMNQDGLTEYVADFSAMKGKTKKPTCEDNPCVGDDCFLVSYIKRYKGLIQRLAAKPTGAPACPATAAKNTKCLNYCVATVGQCPDLFRDIYDVGWNYRVTNWGFHKQDFSNPYGLPSSRSLDPIAADGLVLAVGVEQLRDTLCNTQEISQGSGNVCAKYYQWDASSKFLHDIWRPRGLGYGGLLEDHWFNNDRWNRDTVKNKRGNDSENDNNSFKLKKHSYFAINTKVDSELLSNLNRGKKQYSLCPTPCPEKDEELDTNGDGIPDVIRQAGGCVKPCYKDFLWGCVDIRNTTANEYFVPNKTAEEFSSFFDNRNIPDGVSLNICELKYDKWQGHGTVAAYLNLQKSRGNFRTLSELASYACSVVDPPCGTTTTVSVHRDCLASIGKEVACSKCDNDSRIDARDRRLSCRQTIICPGPTCIPSDGGGDGGGGGN